MARNWEGLSSHYRTRLERAGITKEQYESGASIKAARGHGATPEHGPQVQHLPKSPRVREQYVVGRYPPGKRGGGKPPPRVILQALGKTETDPLIASITFLAPERTEDRFKRYKRKREEEEEEELEEEGEEGEKPRTKPQGFPPSDQEVYTSSFTLDRGDVHANLDPLLSLESFSQQQGLVDWVMDLTGGKFGQITQVLQVSFSNQLQQKK